MESAGWELKAIDEVAVPSGLTRRQDLERLQHRALSTLAHLDNAVVEAGLYRIKSALAEDPRADDQLPATIHDLLVLNRP
jgi:hypothetical protein